MVNAFESLKELIETGLSNDMPRDSRLIILGQIVSAVTRDELTNNQAYELEDMLGGREQFADALSFAIFGRLEQQDLAA